MQRRFKHFFAIAGSGRSQSLIDGFIALHLGQFGYSPLRSDGLKHFKPGYERFHVFTPKAQCIRSTDEITASV
jgi:hypothetical protein